MNNVINEIKNTPVGTKSSIMEVEDRMAKINETERKKKKKYKEMGTISETSVTMLNPPTFES